MRSTQALTRPTNCAEIVVMLLLGSTLAAAQSPVAMTNSCGRAEDSLPCEVAQQRQRVLSGLMGSIDPVGRPPIRWTLAERMTHYHVPAVSIAVIEGGHVTWTAAQGVTSSTGVDSVTPETLFQAASLSKPITVSGMLRLVDQGRLSLDTDVNDYLTTWKVPDNQFTQMEKVTLRQLASHRAGMSPSGFNGYLVTDAIPSIVRILEGAPPANSAPVRVDTVPGRVERYSGGGTVVIEQTMTDATGITFPALMQQLILAPIGMRHSAYEQPLGAVRSVHAARGHDAAGKPIPGAWNVYPELGPAGLWSTAEDIARWAVAITESWTGKPRSILTQRTAEEMLTSQGGRFGIGPGLQGDGLDFQFHHDGANQGYRAKMVMFPRRGSGVVIMTNSDNGDPLITEILRAVAAEMRWSAYAAARVQVVTLDSSALAGLVGTYMPVKGRQTAAQIVLDRGRVMFHAPGVDDELLPESGDSFVAASLGWHVNVIRDAAGRAMTLRMIREDGVRVDAARIAPK